MSVQRIPPASLFHEVITSLSSVRLSAYRVGPDEQNDAVLGRYLWNVALAEAMYPTIHFLEVALRNSFHGAIAVLAGPSWFDDPNVVVSEHARAEILQAKRRIEDRGHPADGPRVIAGLDLGFWAGLCNRMYEQGPGIPAAQVPLWPGVMRQLGPLLPQALRTRQALSEFLGRVRITRNRAFHHEPLWAGQVDRRGAVVPLSVDHAQMQVLVRSLNPRVAALMLLSDRFGDVFDPGPEPWTRAVQELCLREGIEA